MKGKIKILGILAILMLVTPLTAVAGTLKTDAAPKEGDLKLNDFERQIDDVFNEIKVDFPVEYKYLNSQVQSALSKATFVNENGIKMVDFQVFEAELNAQPAGIGRNVIRAYHQICIYTEKDSYVVLRNRFTTHLWWMHYEHIYKSNSYSIKIYEDCEYIDGEFTPTGDLKLNGKLVFVLGWPEGVTGNPDYANGFCGIAGDVLAIGSLTEQNCNQNAQRNPQSNPSPQSQPGSQKSSQQISLQINQLLQKVKITNR